MQDDYDSQGESPGRQKRKRYSRVSRACNECRVRKIRCNGRTPCEPCEEFDRHCTYTSTKGQRVAGAPRTKILEEKLRKARALLSKMQAQNPSPEFNAEVNGIFESPPASPSSTSETPAPTDLEDTKVDYLEIMLDARGRIVSNADATEYYGPGSGFAFVHNTHQLFGQLNDGSSASPQFSLDEMSQLFDSPLPDDDDGLVANVPLSELLPPKQTAVALVRVAFGQVYQLLQFLHEPTFSKAVDRLYDLDPIDHKEPDLDFLPLFHSVAALGYLFHQKGHQKYGCRGTIRQATRHFIAARRMVNLDECSTLGSLQTLMCLILFLMATSRLASARICIGLAAAACMRMGLHSQSSCDCVTEFQKDTRKRLFWAVVKADIYTGLVLGLPSLINLEYVDQRKPSGLSRDYADEDRGGYTSIPMRQMSAASAQYLEALTIMGKVVRKLYPKTDKEAGDAARDSKVRISHSIVSEIEENFKVWRAGLSEALGPADSHHPGFMTSIVYELEMIHNFGHILLYRPFLHYLARTKNDKPPAARLLRCATACVKISRFTITRSSEMLKQGYLVPAAWHYVYTIFLSLVTLLYFLATQHGNKEYAAIHKDASMGIRILASTSCQGIGSRRCLDVLRVLAKSLSHVVNLDVDKLCHGVMPLCISEKSRSPKQSRNNSTSPSQSSDSSASHTRRAPAAVQLAKETDATRSDSRQYAYRPHAPNSIPAVDMSAQGVPFHPPPEQYNNFHLSMWEQSAPLAGGHQSGYLGRFETPHVASPAFRPLSPSGHPMEPFYTDSSWWAGEIASEPPAGRRSSQPDPVRRSFTHPDIPDFPRSNPEYNSSFQR